MSSFLASPDESPLLDRLTATDKSRMPPKEAGEALPKQKIAAIKKWIAEGAKLDAGLTPRVGHLARAARALAAAGTAPKLPVCRGDHRADFYAG